VSRAVAVVAAANDAPAPKSAAVHLTPTGHATEIAGQETGLVHNAGPGEWRRCDMTNEFPFLVTKLSPYYDR
jgi:hypothetical protein